MLGFHIRSSIILVSILGGLAQADPQKTAVIELREDKVHSSPESPFFTVLKDAQDLEKLIITSSSGKSLIIKKDTTWDLSRVAGTNTIIEFAGNARLVCEPGARLHGTGGVLRFVDDARLIVGKE